MESLLAQELHGRRRTRYCLAQGATQRALTELGVLGGTESNASLDALGTAAAVPPGTGPLAKSTLVDLAAVVSPALASLSAYSAIGQSVQVVVVEQHAPLFLPFVAAQEARVAALLLWDEPTQRFVGMMTVSDFVRVLMSGSRCAVSATGEPVASLTELTNSRISDIRRQAWFARRDSRSKPAAATIRTQQPADGPFASTGSGDVAADDDLVATTVDASLMDALQLMLQHRVGTLPLMVMLPAGNSNSGPAGPSSPGPAAAATNVSNAQSVAGLLTFPSILSFIVRSLLESDVVASLVMPSPGAAERPFSLWTVPLCRLPLAQRIIKPTRVSAERGGGGGGTASGLDPTATSTVNRPVSLSYTDPVTKALELFLEHEELSVIAVLDDNRLVTDALSKSDVLRLECCGSYDVTLPLNSALSLLRESPPKLYCCTLQDELGDVLTHFGVQHGRPLMKSLFVVDGNDDSLVGYLSARQVLDFLVDCLKGGGVG